jgi:tetratricopeptide (TPR) repeat protein
VGADLVHRKRRSRGQSYVFKHALIQETAYESMLRRARLKVHADIARALEERFPDAVFSRVDVLALHLAAADEKVKAIWCILEAATGAFQRSALAEAVGFAQQALGWLETIGPSSERTELELNILGVQNPAIAAMKGPGAPEVEAGNARAQALLDDMDGSRFALPTLGRLTLFYQMRARFPEAIATGRRCLALAERAADTLAQLAALSHLAQNLMFTAALHESREAAERALSLYDPEEHPNYFISVTGVDPRVVCHGTLGLVLWFLGYPEQALTHARTALTLAEELDHANSVAWALLYLMTFHYHHRDRDEVRATSARLREVSERHGLYLGTFATLMDGWLAHDVEVQEQILAGLRAYGQVFSLSAWSSHVAESYAARGRLDAAIERLDACIAESEATGEVYYVPELLRLKGRFILQRDGGATALAEACLRRAIALARARGSRMCELRAAVTLGGILRSVGRPGEARDVLEPSYSGFTEGHDRADLMEARALLDTLAG